jgi:hypothetical protein
MNTSNSRDARSSGDEWTSATAGWDTSHNREAGHQQKKEDRNTAKRIRATARAGMPDK